MTLTRTNAVRLAAAAIALAGAGVIMASRWSGPSRDGEQPAYFYDESEKQLFTAPKESIPPIEGIGGAKGDGVRAVLVACRGQCADPAKCQIAYLEKLSPKAKEILEAIRAASRDGKPEDAPTLPGDPLWLNKESLIRRVTDDRWVSAASPEGLAIYREWMETRCPDGRPRVTCSPP